MHLLRTLCTQLTSIAAAFTLLFATGALAQCPGDDDNGANDTCDDTPSFGYDGTSSTRRVADTDSTGESGSAGDDWYYLSLPPGASVDFTANFSHANGDIDIRLYEGCPPTLLDFSISYSDTETVSYMNAGGNFIPLRLRIYMFSTSGCNDYTLTTTVTGDVACTVEDLYDNPPFNNDTCATARFWNNTPYNGASWPGDDDWFLFTVPPASGLKVDLLFRNDLGNLDLRLEAPCGTYQTVSQGSSTDDESLQYVNASGAAVSAFVRIYNFGGPACAPYTLVTEIVPCILLEDSFEPNDDCASAISLSEGSYPQLQVSDGDGGGALGFGPGDDWWTISVDDGHTLTVDVLFSSAAVDLAVRLFDACGGIVLDTGNTQSDNEQVTYANSSGATVDLKLHVVTFTTNGCNLYDMDIDLTQTACLTVVDDDYEDNDDCSNPFLAASGTDRFVSADDPDWYGPFTVADGDSFSADILHSHCDANIDIALRTSCFFPLASSVSTSDNESLSWSNWTGAAVDVVLGVYVVGGPIPVFGGYYSDCGTYDFTTSQTVGVCSALPDDPLEENDDCASATSLASNSLTTGLYVQEGDDDWYSVSVPNSATLDVNLLFSHADMDIDVAAYESCGGLLAGGSVSVTDNESFSFTNQTGARGTYFIHVYPSIGDDCANYDLDLTLSGGTGANIVPYCFGDGSGTQCPCNNNSTAGHIGGCAHQDGEGAVLAVIGTPSVGADTLHFGVTNAAALSFALLTSSINKLPQMGACVGCGIPAFDGLRCAGGGFLRHGTRSLNSFGATGNGWGPPNGPPGGLAAAAGLVAGQTRHYFAFFRTDTAQTCTTGSNSTNAISVTWGM